MRALERALWVFGYLFAFLLFFRAHTVESTVRRLRLAYRLVGVKIVDRPAIDGAERTIFLCPYRNLGANRWGRKWLCHEKLDRVDDGYVSFLASRRDITYRRPRSCARLDGVDERYCFSEVSQRATSDGA